MSNIYEIARILQMPGLEIKATFMPTRLTTRMFNSARKMIASGRIEGNGGAAKVARTVLDSRNVSFVNCNKWGLGLSGGFALSAAGKDEIRELNEAYIVIESSRSTHFDEDDRKRARAYLEQILDGDRTWLSMYNAELRNQIADVYLKNRRPADLQNAQQLLTAYESGEPFPIHLSPR